MRCEDKNSHLYPSPQAALRAGRRAARGAARAGAEPKKSLEKTFAISDHDTNDIFEGRNEQENEFSDVLM